MPHSLNYNALNGKVILITGACGDIGRASIRLLTDRGARVIAIDKVDAPTSDDVADPAITWLRGDVTDEASVSGFIAEALKIAGQIDVLVNNAGIEGPVGPITDLSIDDFTKVFAVNVRGVFLCMKYVIPIMKAAGGGSIINMASTAGLSGTPGASAYIASKHAVIGLTRAGAAEWAGSGVRVNCLAPGPIDGRMMESIMGGLDAVGNVVRERIPSGRFGSPDEVASVIAFLASDDARHMHGTVIPVDGGRTAV